MKTFFSVMFLVGTLAGFGCVRTTFEPEYTPRVSSAQNSDGLITLSWESRVGYDYVLLAKDANSTTWNPVKGASVFHGTGKTITVTDKRNPRQPLPWYSVRAEKR